MTTLRDDCIYCGSPLTLTAEPRVGPAPRFVYRCGEGCEGEKLRSFVIDAEAARLVAIAWPDMARWAFCRCCP